MARTISGWSCGTKGCPNQNKLRWGKGKHPKPGAHIYRALVCKHCKRPCVPLHGVTKTTFTLAELL